jgi:hypothetical protein
LLRPSDVGRRLVQEALFALAGQGGECRAYRVLPLTLRLRHGLSHEANLSGRAERLSCGTNLGDDAVADAAAELIW